MVSSYDFDELVDESLTMTYADFLYIFYADATIQYVKRAVLSIFNIYFIWTTVSAIRTTFSSVSSYYNETSFLSQTSFLGQTSFLSQTSFLDQAMTPNLPFCEAPFAMTPYMAQGASAMAHFPYVPLLLLGIFYASPDIVPSFIGPNSRKIKNILWIQTALQIFTSVGGHMLPNPRMVLNQEISISLAFVFLYLFFDFTTTDKWLIDFGAFATVTILSIIGFLHFGLMPIIFTLFFVAVALSYMITNAFGLLTDYSNKLLLSIFIPTSIILAVETLACDWLQSNISYLLPYHLLFDILFWQVLGSAIDIIIISPIPGRFLRQDKLD
jgi:hypothetical protein